MMYVYQEMRQPRIGLPQFSSYHDWFLFYLLEVVGVRRLFRKTQMLLHESFFIQSVVVTMLSHQVLAVFN